MVLESRATEGGSLSDQVIVHISPNLLSQTNFTLLSFLLR